jgi:hypothetical protein
MKRLLFILVSLAALALPVGALGEGHGRGEHGRGQGNVWAAHACRHGGYQSLVGSDGTRFGNVGACVRYAAHGGTFTSAPAGAALSTGDGFVIPAGAVATISGAHWNLTPCDALNYGYQLGRGPMVTLASKPAVCENGNLPGATIGPFTSQTVLRIFLTDNGPSGPQAVCSDTFYSNGSHALVSGNNPWQVDIRDSSACTAGTNVPLSPAGPGQGNLSLSITVTNGPATTYQHQHDDDQGQQDDQHGNQQQDHNHQETSHPDSDD